ncbi:MAG: hypothetical protein ACK4TB_10650 [Gemmobacter sp.]
MRTFVSLKGAAVIAALAAWPASAELYEIYPTNKRSPDGSYQGVLDVVQGGRSVTEFRVDRGDIPARTVLDARAAIAHVVAQFNLSPARDVVRYCPGGIVRVSCANPGGLRDGGARVVSWP